jgi:hypothetical protein
MSHIIWTVSPRISTQERIDGEDAQQATAAARPTRAETAVALVAQDRAD